MNELVGYGDIKRRIKYCVEAKERKN